MPFDRYNVRIMEPTLALGWRVAVIRGNALKNIKQENRKKKKEKEKEKLALSGPDRRPLLPPSTIHLNTQVEHRRNLQTLET